MEFLSIRKYWILLLALIVMSCIILKYEYTTNTRGFNDSTKLQIELIQYIFSQLEQSNNGREENITDISESVRNLYTDIINMKILLASDILPHLLKNKNSLRPAFIRSRGRSNVSIILGIPSVKRESQNYLMQTLNSLICNMNSTETNETLIVVLIAEIDIEYVKSVAKMIREQFFNELESGLIDIISPDPSYYPDFSRLPDTLNDDHKRVVWRSKENLDYVYLMAYSQSRGKFYIQLEDDIITTKNFITNILSFIALQKMNEEENWVMLHFSQLGSIGQLYKCSDLPSLVKFFSIFYNDKPIDWLIDDFLYVKVCRPDVDYKICRQDKSKLRISYSTSLFQHVGRQSSLKGKIQTHRDMDFGQIALYTRHHNPDAIIESRMKDYDQFTITDAYTGDSLFWAKRPEPGDYLTFKFSRPIFIKKYLFRSGNAEHPSDKFYDTTVEILPQMINAIDRISNYSVTEDGYIIVGEFDLLGIAQGSVGKRFGKISALRLTVHSESKNNVILSEIFIVEETLKKRPKKKNIIALPPNVGNFQPVNFTTTKQI